MNLETIKQAKAGNEESLKVIYKKYENLIKHTANHYHAVGYTKEDFRSIAMYGIWKGVERFNKIPCKYDPELKALVINENLLEKKMSACLKHNVRRYVTRVWRKEKKAKRQRTEFSYDAFLQPDSEHSMESNLRRMNLVTEDVEHFLYDLKTVLSEELMPVANLLIEGHKYHEIAPLLQLEESVVKKMIREIKTTIKELRFN
jgi:DNA-binding NarL/FixJ family response regulator